MFTKIFKSLFSIRIKKKERHPQIIIDADKTTFSSMRITHSSHHVKRNNFELLHNPNPADKKKAYLRKEIIKDYKFKYSKQFKNYKVANEDKARLIEFLKNKKKK